MLGWTAPYGIAMCQDEIVSDLEDQRSQAGEPSVSNLIRIGMDTSKSVFVLHGVDAAEQPVLRKKLRRKQLVAYFAQLPPTQVGIEACGSAHYWARELGRLGHAVKLLPPQRVKPYVARNKNDAADAEALCEAMSRPRMRFVPVKSAEQQAALMLAGLCDQLTRRRTQLSNSIRGYAAEFGLVAAKGHDKIEPLLARIAADGSLPALARELFELLGGQYAEVTRQLRAVQVKLLAWHRDNAQSRRLAEVPGIGPIGAALLTMKVPDPQAFRCGRDFAAWLGLTPKDHSTAGKQRLGVITRAGDEALRTVLVIGATATIQQARRSRGQPSPWLMALLHRKPPKLAAVALANKNARIAWKLMVSGERYDRAIAARPRKRGQPSAEDRPDPQASRRARRGQGRCAPPAAVALRPALTASAPGASPQAWSGRRNGPRSNRETDQATTLPAAPAQDQHHGKANLTA
jgi:transposase